MRFARDKRGYEYVYLVHESTRGGRSSRPLILYWYRTPPGVKVGRPPFDEEVRQRLEAQNPEIRFDWRAITSAQPPPPDAEHWRERRRAEKALKLARLKEERTETDEQAADGGDARSDTEASTGSEEAGADEDEPSVAMALPPASTEEHGVPADGESSTEETTPASSGAPPLRSRRRRRGRRRKPRPGSPAPDGAVAAPPPDLADPGGPEDAEDSGPEEPGDS